MSSTAAPPTGLTDDEAVRFDELESKMAASGLTDDEAIEYDGLESRARPPAPTMDDFRSGKVPFFENASKPLTAPPPDRPIFDAPGSKLIPAVTDAYRAASEAARSALGSIGEGLDDLTEIPAATAQGVRAAPVKLINAAGRIGGGAVGAVPAAVAAGTKSAARSDLVGALPGPVRNLVGTAADVAAFPVEAPGQAQAGLVGLGMDPDDAEALLNVGMAAAVPAARMLRGKPRLSASAALDELVEINLSRENPDLPPAPTPAIRSADTRTDFIRVGGKRPTVPSDKLARIETTPFREAARAGEGINTETGIIRSGEPDILKPDADPILSAKEAMRLVSSKMRPKQSGTWNADQFIESMVEDILARESPELPPAPKPAVETFVPEKPTLGVPMKGTRPTVPPEKVARAEVRPFIEAASAGEGVNPETGIIRRGQPDPLKPDADPVLSPKETMRLASSRMNPEPKRVAARVDTLGTGEPPANPTTTAPGFRPRLRGRRNAKGEAYIPTAEEIMAAADRVGISITPEQAADLTRRMAQMPKFAIDADETPVIETPGATPRRGLIERAEAPINRLTSAAGRAVKEKAPRLVNAADSVRSLLLDTPEQRISDGLDRVVLEGRDLERRLRHESSRGTRELLDLERELTPKQVEQVGRSLNSESADLSTLSESQRATVERVRAQNQALRRRETDLHTRSEEVFAEYPEGRLSRVLKPGNVVERVIGQRGGVRVPRDKMAHDMPAAMVAIQEAEALAMIPEGAPVRLVKQDGDITLVKFTDSPEGLAARDAFVKRVRESYTGARRDLGKLATNEIRAGDVQQAKMLVEDRVNTPRGSDVIVETIDPVPPDVVAKIFVKSPAARFKVTQDTSAHRIATAETQKAIANLTDEHGPVAIVPKDVAAAAAGRVSPPAGFEFMAGPNYGALGGKFVRSDVAKYVRGAFDGEGAKGLARGVGDELMTTFKQAQLLANPRQWSRQILGNLDFENLMGIPWWSPGYMKWSVRGLRSMFDDSPYKADLVEAGFLDPGYVSNAELGLAEAAFRQGGSSRYEIGRRVVRALTTVGASEIAPVAYGKTITGLGKAFGFGDAWTKAKGYVYAREALGMSKADAIAYVRRWTPDPTHVSDLARRWSTTIFGDPWARYRANVARINLDAAREKPIRLAVNVGHSRVMNTAIRAAKVATGAKLADTFMTDEEADATDNEFGDAQVYLGRNKDSTPMVVDQRFLSTMGDYYGTPREVGDSAGEHAAKRAIDFVGVGDNPLISLIMEQAGGRDRYGRPINPEGTAGGRASAFAKQVLDRWAPKLTTTGREKLTAAFRGEQFAPSQPAQSPTQAFLDVFLGLKVNPVDADFLMRRIARQEYGAIADLEDHARRQIIAGRPVNWARIREIAANIREHAKERRDPLRKMQETRR